MFNENMIMIKYIATFLILFSSLSSAQLRNSKLTYKNKKAICCLIKNAYCFGKRGESNRNGRPGGVHGLHNDPVIDGILPHNGPLAFNNSNNNYIDSLAGLAPIALAMYCFNSAPKLTMTTLTMLLLFIVGSDND